MGLISSIRFVLQVPTNVLMIISSTLGYFFYSGLLTFALLFVRGHYGIGQGTAMLVLALLVIGALIGTLVSGWFGDMLLRRGHLNARVWIPAICYVGAALLLIPGFVVDRLGFALWLDVAGAALLTAANPPLDAARLDIMPAGLWGRAESVRTFVRSLGQAIAPLAFGGLADLIAGFIPKQAPIGTHPGTVSSATASGLEITFLVMVSALALAGLSLLRARHTYARDVATAAAAKVPEPVATPRPQPAA
jgi:MFS family permease